MIYTLLHKKNLSLCFLILTNLLHLCLWFFGAPLIRYGMVYLFILPCIMLGLVQWKCNRKAVEYFYYGGISAYLLWNLISFPGYSDIPLIMQMDYQKCDSTVVKLDDVDIYIPVADNRIGYHAFPSALTVEHLDSIEFRGDKLENGFKAK